MHTVVAQVHGDSQCRRAESGPHCLLQSLPAGVDLGPLALADGKVIKGHNSDGVLIDVRPADSPPLEFYVEFAAELRPAAPGCDGDGGRQQAALCQHGGAK